MEQKIRETPAKKQAEKEVEASLRVLDEQITALESTAGDLRQRLECVVCLPAPPVTEENISREFESELGRAINERAVSIRSTEDLLRDALERLQL